MKYGRILFIFLIIVLIAMLTACDPEDGNVSESPSPSSIIPSPSLSPLLSPSPTTSPTESPIESNVDVPGIVRQVDGVLIYG